MGVAHDREDPAGDQCGSFGGVDGGAPGLPHRELGAERGQDTDRGERDTGDTDRPVIQQRQRGQAEQFAYGCGDAGHQHAQGERSSGPPLCGCARNADTAVTSAMPLNPGPH